MAVLGALAEVRRVADLESELDMAFRDTVGSTFARIYIVDDVARILLGVGSCLLYTSPSPRDA